MKLFRRVATEMNNRELAGASLGDLVKLLRLAVDLDMSTRDLPPRQTELISQAADKTLSVEEIRALPFHKFYDQEVPTLEIPVERADHGSY